jgi:twinkle protein
MEFIDYKSNLLKLVAYYERGLPPGSTTGWPSLDRYYTVGPSQFTVVTGIPQHGKSQWVDSLMMNLLRTKCEGKPWKFLVYSPEMRPTEMHQGMMAEKYIGRRFGEGSPHRMTKQELIKFAESEPASRVTLGRLAENDTFADLLLACRDFAASCRGYQPGVILDPWNQLEHCRPAHMTETDYVSDSLSATIRITEKTGAHVWIVAHPTKLHRDKNGERPVPTPYDISGSAHWFNKPDNCICIHRNPQAKPGDDDYRMTDVWVQKVKFRNIGEQGLVRLRWDATSGNYADMNADYRRAKEGE